MKLIEALRLSKNSCVAFVGAGGKTTAIFQVAREILSFPHLNELGKTILVSTTTHFGVWQASLADQHYCIKSPADLANLEHELTQGVVMLTGEESDDRLPGLSPDLLEGLRLLAQARQLIFLIEADGARLHPLKAPADHEPAIPGFVGLVIVVSGLSGLGKPLNSQWVHRPERFADLSGLKIGEMIIPEAIARVLNHPAGGLKNIPVLARRIALLNQAGTPELQAQARLISSLLIPSYQSAIIASLIPVIGSSQITPEPISQRSTEIYAVSDQVAGIILAAGESSRFGAPKQLLIWRGIPFIRHVAMIALEAGLSPVVVVVGASAETIQKVISDLPVRIVNNLDWESGQSSSIKAGVSGLSRDIGAAIFLMADQPQIPTNLIRYLVETHQITLAPIIAPQSDGQRGNPVLFDSTTFPQLLLLSGDSGGRSLFAHYPVQWVPWHDSRILLDVDTPEAYEKFLEIFPEGEGN